MDTPLDLRAFSSGFKSFGSPFVLFENKINIYNYDTEITSSFMTINFWENLHWLDLLLAKTHLDVVE